MTTDGEMAQPDPWFTPERELMLDIGWLDLWHALREESEPYGLGNERTEP